MAVLIDASVFITTERSGEDAGMVIRRVTAGDERAAIASITASELLVGVHRATVDAVRMRREAFIEGILAEVPVVPFDLLVARTHARLGVDLLRAGTPIGSHDLVVAATALTHGYALLTHNAREFRRVPGLEVRMLAGGG